MSGTRHDGGPAFPFSIHMEGYDRVTASGMSLRDFAAVHVLAAMSARDMYDAGQSTPEQRARLALIEADAMLAERARTKADRPPHNCDAEHDPSCPVCRTREPA